MIRSHDVANAGNSSGRGTPEKDAANHHGGSGNGNPDEHRPSKRLRTACDRCKSRKQRCDSLLPACSNCLKANAICTFPFTNNPRYEETLSSYEYIKSLEERIGTLERKLEGSIIVTTADARAAAPTSAPGSATLPTSSTATANTTTTTAGTTGVAGEHAAGERTYIKPQSRHGSMPHSPISERQHQQSPQTLPPNNSLAHAVGFLSMGGSEGEPFYVGSTSGFSIATLVQAMLTVQPGGEGASQAAASSSTSPAGATGQTNAESPSTKRRNPVVPVPPPDEAHGERMVAAYFDKLQARYPVLDREVILKAHADRMKFDLEAPPKTEEEEELRFKLYMVWALGARILQMTGLYDGPHPPESYYLTALKFFPRVPKLASINFITSLLLLTMWTIRAPKGAGLWHVIGLAIRSCLDLGMHREGYYRLIPGEWERQMRRRLWWSCYSMERTVAGILGRPYAIREKEIDTELPADIDDDIKDPDLIRKAIENPRTLDQPSSTLSVGLHLFRFRQIESKITRTFYTSLTKSPPQLLAKIQPYLNSLETWKSGIPPPTSRQMATDCPPPSTQKPDAYSLLFYYKAVRLLTQPFLLTLPSSSPEFKACLRACGQICQIFKSLHQSHQLVPYSFISLQYVFISGITMLYCLWLSRDESWTFDVANDLRACSTVLFVICEYLESARYYRDAFESLVTITTDYLASDNYQPRGAGGEAGTRFREALAASSTRDADGSGGHVSAWGGIRDTGASDDLWNMIADMTGTDVQSLFRDFGLAAGNPVANAATAVSVVAAAAQPLAQQPQSGNTSMDDSGQFYDEMAGAAPSIIDGNNNIMPPNASGTTTAPYSPGEMGSFGVGGQLNGGQSSGYMGMPLGFVIGSFDEVGGYEWP